MAGSVTWSLLRELAEFRAEKGCVISLYLNLDPSEVPTAGDAQARMNAVLTAADKGDRTDLTHEQRASLKADFDRIATWFDDEFERDGSQGLAVFAAGLDNLWRTLPLAAPVRDHATVNRDVYLAPLVSLASGADGTLIAVVGREQGQLYRLRAGRLEEVAEHFDEQPGQHDQGGWSQGRYQRHIEKLVQEHLKGVAQEVDRSVRRQQAPKVVLVCAEEMRSEFTDALSADAQSALVGWASADAHGGPDEILAAVEPVLAKAEEKEEGELVDRWREEVGRNGRGAAGWEDTLEAASDARVELLLFNEGVDRRAFRCPACGRATATEGSCPLDGTRLEATDAGLDLAVHQTLAHGGGVRPIRRRDDLAPVDGIGALLRF